MANLSASSRIPELDGLRGIAVILVVVYHYAYLGPAPADHPFGIEHLYAWFQRSIVLCWSGVDLFFVLSGFLIGGILLDAGDSPSYYKTFYLRRFYRILPLYYLWIFGYIFVMLTIRRLITAYFPSDPVEGLPGRDVFWLFGFVQDVQYYSSWTLGWAWLTPTWSLAVEEQFYVIAPFLIRRLTKRALFAAMCSVIFLAPLIRLWVHFHLRVDPVSLDPAYTLMPCRADSLAIGVLLALLWRNQSFRKWLSEHGKSLYVLTLIFLVGAVALGIWSPNFQTLPMESVGYTCLAMLYALVLLLVLEKPSSPVASLCRIGWLREVGRISYCIYLIHFAAGWFFHAWLDSVVGHPAVWQWAASSCVAALVVYAIARASWRDIESPLLRRAQAYQY